MSSNTPTSHLQLLGQIKFALSDLSSSNGHHQFEHLCRELAKHRIASNILPATGPVSAGGDQGRDFETFRTHLGESFGTSAFVAKASDGPIAFTCTLQRDNVNSKIRSDLATICSQGTRPHSVYSFTATDVPVAARHKLQEQARVDHGIELEIFDLSAIAEHLCDRDTFWIAEEFLSIPSSLGPPTPTSEEPLPEWYLQDRTRWGDRGAVEPTIGFVSDAIQGLRHARINPAARDDLAFWIELLEPVASSADATRRVRARAMYELAVAHFRGLGSLRPADNYVRSFIDIALESDDGSLFIDAGVLLTYAGSAYALNLTDFSPEDLVVLNRRLRDELAARISTDLPRTSRARLLDALGQLASIPDPTQYTQAAETNESAARERPHATDWSSLASNPELVSSLQMTDKACAVDAWAKLAALLEDTPLFPIEDLSNRVGFFAPILIDQPEWPTIRKAIDGATSRASGDNSIAERSRDLAIQLRKLGRPREALAEFHKAAEHWWNGETLRGALLCMLGASEIYDELGFPQAAKQYALAVAGTAQADGRDSVMDLIPHAVLASARVEYRAGNWVNALELIDVGYRLQTAYIDPDVDPWIENDDMSTLLALFAIWQASRALDLKLVETVEATIDRHGLSEMFSTFPQEMASRSTEEWREVAAEQFEGRTLLVDAGQERTICFAALGTEWTIRSSAEYETVHAAERLASAAQLFLVKLADEDPCFLRSSVEVEVRVSSELQGDPKIERIESGTTHRWRVAITKSRPGHPMDPQEVLEELLTVLTSILLELSLLKEQDFVAMMERVFEAGLGVRLAIGRPYDELAEIVPKGIYEMTCRSDSRPFGEPMTPNEHDSLKWQSGPGPTYSTQEASANIKHRYQTIPRRISFTMKNARSDADFKSTVELLRAEGWRDWHVLTALINISINARLANLKLNDAATMNDPVQRERAMAVTSQPESRPADGARGDQLSESSLRQGLEFSIGPYANNWDLTIRSSVLDFSALRQLLETRYRYWDDDVDHDVPF